MRFRGSGEGQLSTIVCGEARGEGIEDNYCELEDGLRESGAVQDILHEGGRRDEERGGGRDEV